jgi:uncharacterized membrane protein
MLKNNKPALILTTIITLLPILMGLLLWNQLPDPMPSHWNVHGEVDGWTSKTFSVFAFPLLMVAIHWICILGCSADPKQHNHHPKIVKLLLWICPVLSLALHGFVYSAALGNATRIEIFMPILMSVIFLIVGNLLPKCKQSYTMGIKLPWTLNSEENWNATHRFGGKVWVAGSIVILATAFLGLAWIFVVTLIMMVALPTLYSYLYFRRHSK